MDVVVGRVAIEDVEEFLERLQEIGRAHESLVQAVDTSYIAGYDHLERATTLAKRAHERGEGIANELAVEVLLYVAGTRQIDRALELGVSEGEQSIAIIVEGGDERNAKEAIGDMLDPIDELPAPDEERLTSWFEIGEAERNATSATLLDLVLERVALLEVEK